jgi:archaellum component FlaF (FlaF/FlaG flagellin family)
MDPEVRGTLAGMQGVGRSWLGVVAVVTLFALGAGSAQAATWTVDNPTVSEGDSGTTQVTFTLTASGVSVLGSSIGYSTADGTATAPSDYTAATGTASASILFPSTTVTVDVNGDTTPERDETFRLVLGDGTTGTATIVNDDLPHLRVSDPSVSEHDGSALFTVSLDGAADVSVHYATADGSAIAGQDYTAQSGTLNFSRSDAAKTVAVPIVDDSIHEDTESFALNLSSPSGVAAGGNDLSGTATIADDDTAPPPPPPPPTTVAGTGTGTQTSGASVPAGGLTGSSGSSLTDTTNPQPRLSKPRSRRGTIVIAISCPATELLCRGTLTTFAEPNRHSKVRWLRSERKLGSVTFVIAGGKRAFITTRISRSALKRLRRAGKVSIRSYAVVRDAAGNIGTASVAARLARVR